MKKAISAITAIVITLGFSICTLSYAADQKTMNPMEPNKTTMNADTMDKGTMTGTPDQKMMAPVEMKKDM